MSTDGAGSPGATTWVLAWTSKRKVVVTLGEPGAAVVKSAVHFPAEAKFTWPTYTPFSPSIAQMNVCGFGATVSPAGP